MGPGGRRGVFAPQALHSFQQAPGATQAKSSRQAEQGGEEPSSLKTNTLSCQMTKWNRHQFFKDEIMVYFIIQ